MELQSLGAFFYPLRAEIREGCSIERMDTSLISFDLNVRHRECYPTSGDRCKMPERRSALKWRRGLWVQYGKGERYLPINVQRSTLVQFAHLATCSSSDVLLEIDFMCRGGSWPYSRIPSKGSRPAATSMRGHTHGLHFLPPPGHNRI